MMYPQKSNTKTNQLAIAKKEKKIETAKRQLYMLKNIQYVSRTIITINVCIPLPKIMTAGILPTEIFERIFDFVRAIEEREAEEERKYINEKYCECDWCGCSMTQQDYHHNEQMAKDDIEDDNIDHVNPEWKYCGVVCRERLAGNCAECCECGEMCHIHYDDNTYFVIAQTEIGEMGRRKERMGWYDSDWVCEECVENWDSDEEEEED